MNESQTRKELIDKKLALAGWDVRDWAQVRTELTVPLIDQVGEAQAAYGRTDYALLGKDGLVLAVVEAKKSFKDPREGREQARQYAVEIYKQQKELMPLILFTNGYDIYFWDSENYPHRKVAGFPTRDDLERYHYANQHRKSLSKAILNKKIIDRPYQIDAIGTILDEIDRKRRKFLLVMATGTGKTRTCAALIDILIKTNWCSRVLFLVDRIALQEQAIEAFKEYLPNLTIWPRSDDNGITTDRRIYVSTYPAMLNVIEQDKPLLSSHFFDLIVIDESHRSIYNVYQNIINYFDAMVLGLTATPKDAIDHNTFKIFECDDEVPTFAYTYDEAISHKPPYLCEYDIQKINTRFQLEGINRGTISLEDQKRLLVEGKDVEEINFEGRELERNVSNAGTNTLIVREFMDLAIKDEHGVLPGKSIFFCISKAHARRVQEIFDKLYPEYKGRLAEVIVSDDPRVYGKGGLLDQFKQNDMPRIAISVDMLDTGIDVREIVNLVLAKPVFSYTKFWQMIGRGTRLLDKNNLKTWCSSKDRFLILDCWNNVDFFKLKPKGDTPSHSVPLPVRLFRLYINKLEAGLESSDNALIVRSIEHLRRLLALLPPHSVAIKEQQELIDSLDADFWSMPSVEMCNTLHQNIAPLLRWLSGVDYKAMGFEKDIQEFALARLQNDNEKSDLLSAALREKIRSLPLNVDRVARQREEILETSEEKFWKNCTDERLDEVVSKLAQLMSYASYNTGNVFTELDLEDDVLVRETVKFGPENERISTAKYRELAEQAILELARHNIILQKLRAGHAMSDAELMELERILSAQNPHITEELLRKVYKHPKASLAQFIRHVLGIEQLEDFETTVAKAFESFIQKHSNFSPQQHRFLELLRSFIVEKRGLERTDLVDMPFTQLHSRGILGLFSPNEITEIEKLTQQLVA